MKQYTSNLFGIAVALIIGLTVIACSSSHEHHGLKDRIEAESEHYDGVTLSSKTINTTVDVVEINEGGTTFFITNRKSKMANYNCAECHNQPLAVLQKKDAGKSAHWDVKLSHATEETMNCSTCHASNDMSKLNSITGTSIDINLSYKVCGQCHQKEIKDWVGGAHGKMIGSWAPPRYSNTCTDCHDPHAPSFEKRWPAQYNTQKVMERK